MQRVSTRASVATRVAQSGRNFGGASERCVSERPQCGEQDMSRAVGPATGAAAADAAAASDGEPARRLLVRAAADAGLTQRGR
jgi:hypothetical protein